MSTTDVFASTSTWTCPVGVTTVWARCWAGGGAGAGVTVNVGSGSLCGGGGAGGCYAEKTAYAVTPGVSYTVTVAATMSGSTGNGGTGNDTWFDNTTSGVLARGGAGGSSPAIDNVPGPGGLGSTTGCVGDTVYAGGNGAAGNNDNTTTFVGAGGGGAGSGAAGSNGSGTAGGGGGSALGGTGGNGRTTQGNGNNGSTYGGGGSGGFTTSTTDVSGGNGAAGRLELEYTPAPIPGGSYSVRVAAAADTSITAAPATVDGITPAVGDVVLLKGQTDPTENGPRVWNAAGAAMPFDTGWDITALQPIRIQTGTYGGATALYAGELPITLGTTPLVFFIYSPGKQSGFTTPCPAVPSGGMWIVSHSLGSRYLLCQIARTGSPQDFVTIGPGAWVVERTSLNACTVRPPSAVAFGEYEIMVQRISLDVIGPGTIHI